MSRRGVAWFFGRGSVLIDLVFANLLQLIASNDSGIALLMAIYMGVIKVPGELSSTSVLVRPFQ